MIETLIAAFLAWLQITSPLPLIGLATHYGPPAFMPGDGMRNGEPLDLSAPIVAVNDCRKDEDGVCLNEWDTPWWKYWGNRELLAYLPN